MKKLLIVNGSPRKNGSDAIMTAKAAEIASKYGYESETVYAYDLKLNGCMACMACKKTGRCAQKDCMNEMLEKIKDSDMIIFATPVYCLAETGPMKTFVDRMYPMFRMDPDGTVETDIGKVKKVSVIVTCGAPDGNMTFTNILVRYANMMKMFKVTDFSGTVIPSANPATVLESGFAKDYFGELEFQLEM